MNYDFKQAIPAADRQGLEDGLSELATGGLFLLLGLLFLAEASSPPGLPAGFSAMLLPLVVIGGMAAARRAIAAAKVRLGSRGPRAVACPPPVARRRWLATATGGLAAAIGAGVAILLVTVIAVAPASEAWIPVLDGLLVASVLAYLGHRTGIFRFYVLAVVSAVLGLTASTAAMGLVWGSAVYFSTMGMALVVSGVLALRGFLRYNPPAAQA